jgi:hypothetical protein
MLSPPIPPGYDALLVGFNVVCVIYSFSQVFSVLKSNHNITV